jgi:deoxyribodipyrimidine photolyase-related protein
MGGTTAWVLGDQLTADRNPALDGADRVLIVESQAKLASRTYHRQKLHFVLSAMRRFAASLTERGVEVHYVKADSFAAGLEQHRNRHRPERVLALEPSTRASRSLLPQLGVEPVRGTLFLTHPDEFREWAQGRRGLRMEDFYRGQRRRFDVLLEPDGEPAGGRWNLDADNRERPPKEPAAPPRPYRPREDSFDEEVRAELDRADADETWGEDGPRLFAGSAGEARRALERFVSHRLADFGRFQDAMLSEEPWMWHSMLSAPLNLGLLDPLDCVRAAERAWRDGQVPLNSAEGFIRQIIGWREYVWGMYWLRGERWQRSNALRARASLPSAVWSGETEMRCLERTLTSLSSSAYTHHIQRLMVLGNLFLLAGVDPREATDWFHATHIDGYEWVMEPNVIGMATFADGGEMMSKPYAAGGRYIDRMSDYCGGCRYRPDRRTGDDACPFTAMYWDFLDRNHDRLASNHRMKLQLRNVERIDPGEMAAIRSTARAARRRLAKGD